MRTQINRYSLIDRFFNLIERQRPSDKLLMRALFFIIIASGIFLILATNNQHSISAPAKGGTLVEGIVGIPRFVNPALAITRADQDTVALIYSGLLKINADGNLEPDIAESITVSDDGKTYNITLKRNKAFHDGRAITAKDVVFTISLIQDPDLKSPLRSHWSEIITEQINEYEMMVRIKEPYSPFIENFTIGIMPEHIWGNLPIEQLPFSQYNTEPIGSGSFQIDNIRRDNSGLINSYNLKPSTNEQDVGLSKIELKYFQNEEALTTAFFNKTINSTVFLPASEISKINPSEIQIISEPLPRIFAIFFNQNRSPVLRDKAARQALNLSIDRQKLVNSVLGGYGVPTTKPILTQADKLEWNDTDLRDRSTFSPETAREILTAGGWEQNASGFWEKEIDKNVETLSVTVRTSNARLYDKTISIIADDWRKLGVEVQVEQYEQTGLVQSVIRTRDFQALLFGLDINRSSDMYPFWHSSQKDDPGLNISQYTNVSVDQNLEKIRTTKDREEKEQTLEEINKVINEEIPAIFLYIPDITYVVDKSITVAPMNNLGKPSDRFMNISDWYAGTDTLWPFFHKK